MWTMRRLIHPFSHKHVSFLKRPQHHSLREPQDSKIYIMLNNQIAGTVDISSPFSSFKKKSLPPSDCLSSTGSRSRAQCRHSGAANRKPVQETGSDSSWHYIAPAPQDITLHIVKNCGTCVASAAQKKNSSASVTFTLNYCYIILSHY